MTATFPGGVVLTGRPGSGKTTVVRRTVATLVGHGVRVAGFLTDEVRERGTRVGFDLVVLTPDGRDADRHPLARVGAVSPVTVGRYGIDVAAVSDALPALSGPGDVVVVDEVAPMELKAPGFVAAIASAVTGSRPLLATVHERAGGMATQLRQDPRLHLLKVTPHTRDTLPDEATLLLLRCLEAARHG